MFYGIVVVGVAFATVIVYHCCLRQLMWNSSVEWSRFFANLFVRVACCRGVDLFVLRARGGLFLYRTVGSLARGYVARPTCWWNARSRRRFSAIGFNNFSLIVGRLVYRSGGTNFLEQLTRIQWRHRIRACDSIRLRSEKFLRCSHGGIGASSLDADGLNSEFWFRAFASGDAVGT